MPFEGDEIAQGITVQLSVKGLYSMELERRCRVPQIARGAVHKCQQRWDERKSEGRSSNPGIPSFA